MAIAKIIRLVDEKFILKVILYLNYIICEGQMSRCFRSTWRDSLVYPYILSFSITLVC